MCGITGYATVAGRPVPGTAVLHRMTATLAHRGPDADGFHCEQGVGLGHRRLSIIDVDGGRNPLLDDGGRAALVFNGEIYNYRELRTQLEAAGHRPRTRSDGEVILHGYLEWGLQGLVGRLQGMFAFALHDRQSGTLHLARDPFGIKPLFLRTDGDGLLFGSEMKAILAALGTRPALSPQGLLQAACLGYTLGPGTVFEGIRSLEPGHWASWHEGHLAVGRYHDLEFDPGREQADPEALWERVRLAVRSHLMSEVPLGAFLSGGMDSSAVVTAMTEVAAARVEAVCVGVDEPGMDERPYAREVAGRLGVDLHEERVDPGIGDLLPRLAWHLEMPFCDTSAAPTWRMCAAARRHVVVALSGDGGDENFAGYRRTRFDVLEENWRARLPRLLRRGLLGPLGRRWPRGPWVPAQLRAGTLLENLADDWLDAYVRSLSRIPESLARRVLRPEVLPDEPLRAAFEPAAAKARGYDALSRVQYLDFRTWLADDILVKVDRMSMAHGLEVRVPLLDTAFVGWVAGLPLEAKLDRGRGKALFRRTLRGRVPDAVLDRPKQGFHLPVNSWLRGPLGERIEEILLDTAGPAFELVDHHRFRRLADEHRAERVDRSAELWWLLMADAFGRHGPGGMDA